MKTLIVIAFAEINLVETISEKTEEIASFVGKRFVEELADNTNIMLCNTTLSLTEKKEIAAMFQNYEETKNKTCPIFIEVDDDFETASDHIDIIGKNKQIEKNKQIC